MSFDGLHLLAPGERIRHWPKPPAPPNPPPVGAKEETTDCEGCGAPLQNHLASCAWCTRPHPSRRADLGARLEVTCLDDAAPRYVPGRPDPRPSERSMADLIERAKGADGSTHACTAQGWRDRYLSKDPTSFPPLKRFCRWLLGVR